MKGKKLKYLIRAAVALLLCMAMLLPLVGCKAKEDEQIDGEPVISQEENQENKPVEEETVEVVPEGKKLTQVNKYDYDGNVIEEIVLSYNENRQITEIVYHYEDRDDTSVTYLYDENGYLTESYLGDGKEMHYYYEYDEKGNLIEEDSGYGVEWYEYDSQGRLSTIKGSYNPHDFVTVNTYDATGLLISAETEYTEYENNTTYTETTNYSYDPEGRLSQKVSIDKYGETCYTYDYTYRPFVIEERAVDNNQMDISVTYYDNTDQEMLTLSLTEPQYYIDKDGYLAKIVDIIESSGEYEIYEFCYDGKLAQPVEEPILERPTEAEPKPEPSNTVEDDAAAIYTNYLLNGGYKEIYYYDDYDFDKEDLEVSSCLIDIDNDGIEELLISILNTEHNGPRGYEEFSALLDIKNGIPQIMISAYYGGGSEGGDYLVLKYDQTENKYVIALDGYGRDGIYAGSRYLNICSASGYDFEQTIEYTYFALESQYYADQIEMVRNETSFYTEDDTNFKFYEINGEYVAEEDYNAMIERFIDPVDNEYKLKKGTYDAPIN